MTKTHTSKAYMFQNNRRYNFVVQRMTSWL